MTLENGTRAALNLWRDLLPEVNALLQKSTKLVFPGEPDTYYQWFREIEKDSFREELRYTVDDLEERLQRDDILFLFFLSGDGPEILLLAYSDSDSLEKTIYLDTIAVKSRGQGIGSLVMKTLIEYSRKKGYTRILLDTEQQNDHNQELVTFYRKFGFRETEISEDGNITMELVL